MGISIPAMIKLDPSLIPKIWGGDRFVPEGNNSGGPLLNGPPKIGEAWEISVHSQGPSLVNGKPLSQMIDEADLTYLVKLIDTTDNLSVQVHPDDSYAKLCGHSSGKSECWIILEAGNDAGIFLDLKSKVTLSHLKDALNKNEDISSLLEFYPAKRGDFFYIPAGTIHAIGKNVFLAEIQQNSGITYRLWDWNRLDEKGRSRDLHLKEALDLLSIKDQDKNREKPFYQQNVLSNSGLFPLFKHAQFEVSVVRVENEFILEIPISKRHCGLLCIEGSLELMRDKESMSCDIFTAVLLSKDRGRFLHCRGSGVLIFIS